MFKLKNVVFVSGNNAWKGMIGKVTEASPYYDFFTIKIHGLHIPPFAWAELKLIARKLK